AESFIEGQRATSEALSQRLAIEVLHHQVIPAAFLPDVVEGANMRVVEGGNSARLAFEALADLRPFSGVRRKHLDRDGTVQTRIARFVDFAHAARAEGRQDLVRAEASAGRKRHMDRSDFILLELHQCDPPDKRSVRRLALWPGGANSGFFVW